MKYRDEQIQMWRHIENSSNTNVKPNVNKLITNKRFQFVENIVIRDETSDRNRIRMDSAIYTYSLFRSGSNKYFVYFGIVILFYYYTIMFVF